MRVPPSTGWPGRSVAWAYRCMKPPPMQGSMLLAVHADDTEEVRQARAALEPRVRRIATAHEAATAAWRWPAVQ